MVILVVNRVSEPFVVKIVRRAEVVAAQKKVHPDEEIT